MPDMLFEYAVSNDTKPFNNGKYSVSGMINDKENDYFNLSTIRKFMKELLNALDHLHSHGIMHRDIKPSNLVLTQEGDLKVIDFDLSEFLTPTTDLKFSVSTKGFKPPEI
jgi:serine/threonine protein kinase